MTSVIWSEIEITFAKQTNVVLALQSNKVVRKKTKKEIWGILFAAKALWLQQEKAMKNLEEINASFGPKFLSKILCIE